MFKVELDTSVSLFVSECIQQWNSKLNLAFTSLKATFLGGRPHFFYISLRNSILVNLRSIGVVSCLPSLSKFMYIFSLANKSGEKFSNNLAKPVRFFSSSTCFVDLRNFMPSANPSNSPVSYLVLVKIFELMFFHGMLNFKVDRVYYRFTRLPLSIISTASLCNFFSNFGYLTLGQRFIFEFYFCFIVFTSSLVYFKTFFRSTMNWLDMLLIFFSFI